MKINWGWGIAIFLLIFTSANLTFVYFAFSHEINLVAEDYYPKGLQYQAEIDKKQHASKLEEQPTVELTDKAVSIQLPQKFVVGSTGKIWFYKPETYREDYIIDLNVNEQGKQTIPLNELRSGRYIIKLELANDGTDYSFDFNIQIP